MSSMMQALLGTTTATSGGLKVQDVFDIDLWTGTSAAQSITTPFAPDFAWVKSRSAATDHALFDTTRGAGNSLSSNTAAAQITDASSLTTFNVNGYSLGVDSFTGRVNALGNTYVGWAIKEAPSFFDVVTFTAGTNPNRRIPQSLGVPPGLILLKSSSAAQQWWIYHASLGRSEFLSLNTTSAATTRADFWGATDPTSTDFGIDEAYALIPGATIVAYLFAHDPSAGGIIQTFSGSGTQTFTFGWEPQYIMVKRTDAPGPWYIADSQRGLNSSYGDNILLANSSAAEAAGGLFATSPTGVTVAISGDYVGIAIRAGPM